MKLTDLTKEQLIEEVKKLKSRKKYGLVWEDKPEDVVTQCKEKLPVLEEVVDKAVVSDKSLPTNLIIEGDNYHALSVLNYTHQGKIDVIYIDPPYNTGNKSWKYNNNYIEKEDPYKHSKWLSFIKKRLLLSRSLLSKDGVIVATIDDYEIFPLGLLMDEVFGEQNRIATVSVLNKKSGRSTDKFFATCHEYYLFYANDISTAKVNMQGLNGDEIDQYKLEDEISKYKWRDFLRTGGYSTPEERPNSFYPIYFNEITGEVTIENKRDFVEILPIDSKGHKRVWRQTRPSLLKLIACGDIKIVTNRLGSFSVRIKDRIKKGVKPKTVWDSPLYDAATHGTKLLEKILGKSKSFDFPKSVYAVRDTLKLLTAHKKSVVILDYFAGSGTTGHATMLLNNEDGGNRKFILCTNNESNIAEEVTYPRIKKVIEGYSNVAGIPANVKYFKTTFVSKSNVSDDTRNSLVRKSVEMICVRENTFENVVDKNEYKVFQNGNISTGVLFDLDEVDNFKKELSKLGLPSHIYVFSLTNDTYINDFEDLALDHELCPIPESILEVYRKLFK